jgi:hypothetical protein
MDEGRPVMINNDDGYGLGGGSRARGVPFYGGRPNASQGDDQLPPQHIESEQGVLTAILLDEEGAIADQIFEILSASEFWRADHQTIFAAMRRLYDRGDPVDLVALSNELGPEYVLVGGDLYFAELCEDRARVPNGRFYAQIVKQKAAARATAEAGLEIARDASSGQYTAEELLERAAARIQTIEATHTREDDDELAVSAPLRMAPAAFRGVAGGVVECIHDETEACDEAVHMQFLVAVGNLFGTRPHFMVGGKAHRCNLNTCLVGASSCGKGSAWDALRWMLDEAGVMAASKPTLTGMTSGEGVIAELKESGGQVLAVESEFSRTLNNMNRDGNSLDAILRQAFEDTTLRVPTKNCPLTVLNAHLSVIAHIPEVELRRKMSSDLLENGFAGRFLWARAYLHQLKADGGNFAPVREALKPHVEKLILAVQHAELLNENHVYRRDREAEALWESVYPGLRVRPPNTYGAATSKAAAMTMRLAMIYAVLDRQWEVYRTHLESALAVWDYCDATAKALFGDGMADAKMAKLLAALEECPDGMHRTQIRREVFKSHIGSDELNRLLALARDSGNLVYIEQKNNGTKYQNWMHRKYV